MRAEEAEQYDLKAKLLLISTILILKQNSVCQTLKYMKTREPHGSSTLLLRKTTFLHFQFLLAISCWPTGLLICLEPAKLPDLT